MSIKRKARKRLCKVMDILKPIDINIIGTKDDPCFGRLHSPKEPECQRCGDAEICAIVKAQKLSVKRAKLEAEQQFKDVEALGLKTPDKLLIKKMVRKRIKELIKRAGEKGYPGNKLVQETHVVFFQRGYTKKKIEKMLASLRDRTKAFTYNQQTDRYKWKT